MKKFGFGALVLTFTLAACTQGLPSQNPGPSPQPGSGTQITRQGDVIVIASDVGGTTQAIAGAVFQKIAPTTAPTNRLAAVADTCTVVNGSQPGPDPITPALPTSPLDAGTPLTLKSAGGTYAALTVSPQGTGTYGVNQASPLPAPPQGLSIDIPGAANGFPAFTGAAFPATPQAVALTAPQDFKVTANTTFSWSNPTNSETTLVFIGGVQPSPAASFICVARDDGSFTFSDQTKQQLAAAGFVSGQMNNIGRWTVRTQVQGDAVLNTSFVILSAILP